jgi:DNA invertase Pin-like site-specific DNA recombinase
MPLEEAVEVEAPRARDWKCPAFGIRRGREGSPRGRARARAILHALALKLNQHQRQEAIARRANGEPLTEIARTYAVSHSTISRLR